MYNSTTLQQIRTFTKKNIKDALYEVKAHLLHGNKTDKTHHSIYTTCMEMDIGGKNNLKSHTYLNSNTDSGMVLIAYQVLILMFEDFS